MTKRAWPRWSSSFNYDICINFWNDSTASPGSVYLTGIVDMSDNALSVGVLRFAFHLDDFDSVSDFYLLHDVLLNLTLLPFYIYNKSF